MDKNKECARPKTSPLYYQLRITLRSIFLWGLTTIYKTKPFVVMGRPELLTIWLFAAISLVYVIFTATDNQDLDAF